MKVRTRRKIDHIMFSHLWYLPELKMPRLDLLNVVVLLRSFESSDHGVEGEELLRDVNVLHHHESRLS